MSDTMDFNFEVYNYDDERAGDADLKGQLDSLLEDSHPVVLLTAGYTPDGQVSVRASYRNWDGEAEPVLGFLRDAGTGAEHTLGNLDEAYAQADAEREERSSDAALWEALSEALAGLSNEEV